MENPDRWDDACRIESWAGEVRVNLIRLVAILCFYGNHLLTIYGSADRTAVTSTYNAAVNGLTIAWGVGVLVLYFCLARRWVPPYLKYVATAWDLVLLTLLLGVSGEPRTTLSALYFLIIAAAPLRLSIRLVQAATLGSMAGFLLFLGYVRWGLGLAEQDRMPRTQQIIFVLALGGAGLLAGQVVRQIRRLREGYPVLVEEPEERDHAA
jgi:hypothetical protein